jgi:DNA-binding LacI/PurR family transcriptional regulator
MASTLKRRPTSNRKARRAAVTGGEKRATAKVVAQLAGVSVSAVSRVFTKGASVSPKMRERVLAATQTVGYTPNALARSLMTNRTELIGLVSNNFDNPLFMEIFDLFTRRLQQRGRRPLLANLSGGITADGALGMLQQYNVDGVIVASSTLPPKFAESCAEAGIPTVLAFGRPGDGVAIDIVGADNVQGGRLAARALRQRGYRNIAFLGGPQMATSTQDRLRGLTDTLSEDGLMPCAVVYGHSYCHDAGLILMKQLLRNGGMDAVFCGDDVLAMGALDACLESGVSVPRDLGLIGFNDMAMASWFSYNLTTIRQPVADIIVTAVERVLSLIDEPEMHAPPSAAFDCAVIERGTLRSVPPLRVAKPHG